MHADIERVLIPREKIQHRVRELAEQITHDHMTKNGEGEVTIVPILTGAMIFACDLMRHIPMAMKIGLMTVSSYPGTATTSQGVTINYKKVGDLTGRHVILVDDILDSGSTIRAVVPMLRDMGAATVRVCVLLRKDRPEATQTPADYVGFDIPDEFVVGYGLDYDDYYRNLPDVVTLKREVYAKS
jgi:hypoxanthine phosphoribosyltransferase